MYNQKLGLSQYLLSYLEHFDAINNRNNFILQETFIIYMAVELDLFIFFPGGPQVQRYATGNSGITEG